MNLQIVRIVRLANRKRYQVPRHVLIVFPENFNLTKEVPRVSIVKPILLLVIHPGPLVLLAHTEGPRPKDPRHARIVRVAVLKLLLLNLTRLILYAMNVWKEKFHKQVQPLALNARPGIIRKNLEKEYVRLARLACGTTTKVQHPIPVVRIATKDTTQQRWGHRLKHNATNVRPVDPVLRMAPTVLIFACCVTLEDFHLLHRSHVKIVHRVGHKVHRVAHHV